MVERWFGILQRGGFVAGIALNILSIYLDAQQVAGWPAWVWMLIGTLILSASLISIIRSQDQRIVEIESRPQPRITAVGRTLPAGFHTKLGCIAYAMFFNSPEKPSPDASSRAVIPYLSFFHDDGRRRGEEYPGWWSEVDDNIGSEGGYGPYRADRPSRHREVDLDVNGRRYQVELTATHERTTEFFMPDTAGTALGGSMVMGNEEKLIVRVRLQGVNVHDSFWFKITRRPGSSHMIETPEPIPTPFWATPRPDSRALLARP